MEYLTAKEASKRLGLSVASISACVQRGAPVHRWGPTGYRYRIDPDEFIAWMNTRRTATKEKAAAMSREEVHKQFMALVADL